MQESVKTMDAPTSLLPASSHAIFWTIHGGKRGSEWENRAARKWGSCSLGMFRYLHVHQSWYSILGRCKTVPLSTILVFSSQLLVPMILHHQSTLCQKIEGKCLMVSTSSQVAIRCCNLRFLFARDIWLEHSIVPEYAACASDMFVRCKQSNAGKGGDGQLQPTWSCC